MCYSKILFNSRGWSKYDLSILHSYNLPNLQSQIELLIYFYVLIKRECYGFFDSLEKKVLWIIDDKHVYSSAEFTQNTDRVIQTFTNIL